MDDRVEERRAAIDRLISEGILRTKPAIRAMLTVPREQFLPEEMRMHAYADIPLPIGCGQTTSALHMTAMICEYTEMKSGDKILEVGGGSGYMSCVYAEIVAPSVGSREQWGYVWSIEIVEKLAERAKQDITRIGYADRVKMICADASEGIPEYAPYDAIVVTSAAPCVPDQLKEQLVSGGRLLIPVGDINSYQTLMRITKMGDGKTKEEALGSVAFVPMRGKMGWPI